MKAYKEYEEKELKKLQKTQLEMLKDFVYICEKYKIDYFGLAGTVLGAVRHKGFIPWDDDIDLAFLRKDYNKFRKYAEKEFNNKYYFISYIDDSNYFLPSVRWCKRGTVFVEEALKSIKSDLGIFLDLYPFDYVSDNKKKQKKQIYKAWFLGKLAILKNTSNPVLFVSGLKKVFILLTCKIVYFILNILKFNHTKLISKSFKYLNKEKDKTNTIVFPYETNPFQSLYNVKDIYPTKTMEFENIKIKVPKNYEKILKQAYGNYMELPPEDKRHNHYPYRLEFKKEK